MSIKQSKKIEAMLLKGEFSEAEEEVTKIKNNEIGKEFQTIIQKITESQEGREKARQIMKKNNYKEMRAREITIKIINGIEIKIKSWYAVKQGRKMGKFKKGSNGRGIHLLLSYWGFIGKNSFNYETKIARTGIACASYELARKELKEQGISITGNGVNKITQKVGSMAQEHRENIGLQTGESFKNKRIIIAIDGGRIRTRQNKTGRYRKEQKRVKYKSEWKEPKLLVISEIDPDGNKEKDAKPIYEATMGNHNDLFNILEKLANQCQLNEAREIILSGDGAKWIWKKYQEFSQKQKIEKKSTQILDFYHATEHLSQICEENTSLNKKEQKIWFKQLRTLLWEGKLTELKRNIEQESKNKNIASLLTSFQYFERNKNRMQYDKYRKNKQPIGSGIVESAIRRVINLKLKSPSTFWKVDNLERMLHLRCILMTDRWNIFKSNLLSYQ